MSVANDRRYIRGRRCPICGGSDGDARGAGRRCFGFLSADGEYAHCSREEYAGPIPMTKPGTVDTYAHRLADSCACGQSHSDVSPVRAVDIGTIVAEYNYHDESGVLLYQVRRYGPVKTFRQFRPDGSGGWIPGLDPKDRNGKPTGVKTRRILYRLDRLIEADPSSIVWICEGEKDVHAMESLGFVATTNPMGAGKWHMITDCAKRYLKGRNVVIVAHDDTGSATPTKGRDHAADVAKRLKGIATSVRVIDPVRGNDAASWIEQGGTAEEFLAAIPALPPPELTPQSEGGSYGLAVTFVRQHAMHPDGPTIRRWRGAWYAWDAATGSYRERTDERINTWIRGSLGLTEPKDVADVRTMTISVPDVAVDDVELGGWVGGGNDDDVVACPNGILDLATRRITTVTPRMFTTATIGAAYDAHAPDPMNWLTFLRQVFPDDQASIDTLQEWFGYHLTPDTRQQKIMWLVGRLRSGKGTILRILSELVGQDNVATPTLDHLGLNFGVQPLIGKTAAIIGDARIDDRTNMAALTSRLLGISGRDKQTIDRKRLSAWIGFLSVRFTIACNATPEFKDSSDALMKRAILLSFRKSFFGQEDIHLESRLLTELPGILLWALDGWARLRARGHFVQPAHGSEMVDDMIDLANPVAGWLRERCVVDVDGEVTCKEAYDDFVSWAEKDREKIMSKKAFGSRLMATGMVVRDRDKTSKLYRGISLKILHI